MLCWMPSSLSATATVLVFLLALALWWALGGARIEEE
jgi:hypothetical protein